MKNDGGPAFSRSGRELQRGIVQSQEGMSLRDYFAAAALQGMLSGDCDDKMSAWQSTTKASEWAYEFADAMIAQRSK